MAILDLDNFDVDRTRKEFVPLDITGRKTKKPLLPEGTIEKAKEIAEPVVGAGEAALALGSGALSFIPSEIAKFTQVGSEKLAQKVFGTKQPGRFETPEAVPTTQGKFRGEILGGKTTSEDILARGENIREALNFAYQPKTETGQVLTEKASELLDTVLAPARAVGNIFSSDEVPAYLLPFLGTAGGASPIGIKAKGTEKVEVEPSPILGDILKLAGELALFEVAGVGLRAAKVKIKGKIKDANLGLRELEALGEDIAKVPLERQDAIILDELVNEAKVESVKDPKVKARPKTSEEVVAQGNRSLEELRADPKTFEEILKESEAFEAEQRVETVAQDLKDAELRSTVEHSKEVLPEPKTSEGLTNQEIRRRKPDPITVVKETELKLREQVDPLTRWLEGEEGIDIGLVEESIKSSLSELNPRNASHMDMIESGDKMLTALNRKKGELTQSGRVVEEIELREDMRVSEEELDAVINYMEEGHGKYNEAVEKGEIVNMIDEGDPYAGLDASMLEDVKTLVQSVLGEDVGVIGDRSLSIDEIASMKRLSQKLRFEKKNLVTFLQEKGMSAEQAQFVMDSIKSKNPLTPVEGAKTGEDYQDLLTDGDSSIVIKQRSRKVKGQEVSHMPITVADRIMLKTLPKVKRGILNRSFETAIRTFDELSAVDVTKTLKEGLYDPWRSAEKRIGERLKVEEVFVNDIRKQTSNKERLRIGTSWIAEQPEGIKILERMGIKEIPELTPKEFQIRDSLQTKFDELWTEINNARVRIGQRPMGKLDNYLTFFRTQGIMDKLGLKSNLVNDLAHNIDVAQVQHKATAFEFAKKRKRKVVPIELDPLKIYGNYVDKAVRHINVSPIVDKVSELRRAIPGENGKNGTLVNYNPVADNFIRGWSNRIAGQGDPSRLPKIIQKGLNELGVNMAFSVLSGNIRTVLIQPSVLLSTMTELGPVRTIEGMIGVIAGTNLKSLPKELATLTRQTNRALKQSEHLPVRSLDVSLRGMQKSLIDYKGIKSGIGKLGLKPMMYVDMLAAEATFRGAYAKAVKDGVMKNGKLKKLSHKDAIKYADDVTVRTNASGLPGDMAPIQANALGKTLTMFQTFVINNWDFLTKDVAGIGRADIKSKDAIAKVTRYVVGATMANMFYEDVLGINSPLPTPFRTLYENRDEEIGTQVLGVAKEFLEPIPILGGMRYGSSILGPVAELAGDASKLLTNDPYKKSIYEVGGKTFGVPATAQVGKSIRAAGRGENLYDTVLGNYTGGNSGKGRKTRKKRKPR